MLDWMEYFVEGNLDAYVKWSIECGDPFLLSIGIRVKMEDTEYPIPILNIIDNYRDFSYDPRGDLDSPLRISIGFETGNKWPPATPEILSELQKSVSAFIKKTHYRPFSISNLQITSCDGTVIEDYRQFYKEKEQ